MDDEGIADQSLPLEGSGSGTYTKNIALHLQKRGHEVCVVFPENQPFSLLPGIRMYPVLFSRNKPQKNALPFNFPCFTTHPQSRTTFADLGVAKLTQYHACSRNSLILATPA